MTRFDNIQPQKYYTKEQTQQLTRNVEELLKTEQTIVEFFKSNPDLEDALRKTGICGLPTTAIFTNPLFCNGKCDYISRVFASVCPKNNVKVATGVNAVIANNYYDDYIKSYKNAHHTWVEMLVDGEVYVLDFTFQIAAKRKKYYQALELSDSSVTKFGKNAILLQQMTSEAFWFVARDIRDYSNRKTYLEGLYEYCTFMDRNLPKENGGYCFDEACRVHDDLLDAGISYKQISEAEIVYRVAYERGKLLDQQLEDVVKQNYNKYGRQPMRYKRYKAIMDSIFPNNKNVRQYAEQIYGPKENSEEMRLEIEAQ
jgi:hypothetical protein